MSTDATPVQAPAAIVCIETRGTFTEIAKSVAMAGVIDIATALVTKQPAKLGRKTIMRGVAYWAFYKLIWPAMKPLAERGAAEGAMLMERMKTGGS